MKLHQPILSSLFALPKLAILCIISAALCTGCDDNSPPTAAPTAGTALSQSAGAADDFKAIKPPSTSDERAKRLDQLRAAIIEADQESANSSPYQIQLGIDDSISFSIIGEQPNLALNFTNQDNESINLAKAYPGKILVLATIYTSCPLPDMCPRLTTDYAALAQAIPVDLRAEVQLILVSFDPQRDTPEVLKAYGRQHNIDFEMTDLLRGPIDQTQPLLEEALQIPLEINPETNMIVTHAMMLHIIDRAGYIVVERTVSSSAPMELVAEEITRAALLPFDPSRVPLLDEESGKIIAPSVNEDDG